MKRDFYEVKTIWDLVHLTDDIKKDKDTNNFWNKKHKKIINKSIVSLFENEYTNRETKSRKPIIYFINNQRSLDDFKKIFEEKIGKNIENYEEEYTIWNNVKVPEWSKKFKEDLKNNNSYPIAMVFSYLHNNEEMYYVIGKTKDNDTAAPLETSFSLGSYFESQVK